MTKRLRVMSSDDDEGIRALLFSLLTEQGHEVEFARDSDELFKNLGRARYDLLILDVNMPGLNGYKVAEKITNNLVNRPRILIFTSRDIGEERLQFVTSGADAIVRKGEPCENILRAIEGLFVDTAAARQGYGRPEGEARTMKEITQLDGGEREWKKTEDTLRACQARITQVEDLLNTKSMRYEEFIRDLLREKQRTEKNYLEFKRIETEVLKLKSWSYAVIAVSALALAKALF